LTARRAFNKIFGRLNVKKVGTSDEVELKVFHACSRAKRVIRFGSLAVGLRDAAQKTSRRLCAE
jgi:hypothetical protein